MNIRLGKYRPKLGEDIIDAYYDDEELAPVMPAIDAVQQLIERESQTKLDPECKTNDYKPKKNDANGTSREPVASTSKDQISEQSNVRPRTMISKQLNSRKEANETKNLPRAAKLNQIEPPRASLDGRKFSSEFKQEGIVTSNQNETFDDEHSLILRNNPLNNFTIPLDDLENQRQSDYEFIPKSVTLDIYSNDPEVKRFLKQLPKIPHESGLNEQDYKCYSCRRPIGLVFGQPRLCHFDGHHYCSECHLNEKAVIPARILCNWDFNKFPVSKRNQHFLSLISNESMFEIKKIAPLLHKTCSELRDIEELRRQAFFVRSYCTTCVQDSISFELTKLIWPREHLIKQTDIYSLEDLIQIRNGNLKQALKNVITFGRQHVLSCVLCCQKGFICELCKSSQIIYPFDTESVHRCNECQSIYHKSCFKSKRSDGTCPRCERLKARSHDT